MKRADLKTLHLPDGSAPSPDDINNPLSLSQYTFLYAQARGYNITKIMWLEVNMDNYELFYLADSFVVENSTENYVDNSMFCSVENSKVRSKENVSISLGNKSVIFLTED